MRRGRQPARVGLALMEVLVCVMFVGIGYVAIVKTMTHAIRITERADVRSEITTIAHREVETLRAIAAQSPDFQPDYIRSPPGRSARVCVTSSAVSGEPLVALQVSAESLHGSPPVVVTMTGWVARAQETSQ